MNFKDMVANEYRKRISNGINREKAKSFHKSDFPNVSADEIADFCDCGYATLYIRSNFSLNEETADEFERQ